MKKKGFCILLVFFLIGFCILYFYPNLNYTKNICDLNHIELYDSNDTLLYEEYFGQSIQWVSFDQIPKVTKQMLVEIEDKDFYSHQGFDLYRMVKSLYENMKSGKNKEGASTITQQLARRLFLTNDKTIKRKLSELFISISLEKHYSKEEILEAYLNTMYYGHGIYGIENASLYYFHHSSSSLSIIESLILISILNNPTVYDPIHSPKECFMHVQLLSKILYKRGILDIDSIEMLPKDSIDKILDLGFVFSKKDSYIQAVMDILSSLKIYQLGNCHLIVKTYYDKEKMDTLNQLLLEDSSSSEHGIVIEENKTGNILALYEGKNGIKHATKSQRQIGSTVKPFLYYLALENGVSPLKEYKSEYFEFAYKKKQYQIHNYGSIYENSPITMAYAISTSDNVYAVKTLLSYGIKGFSSFLEELEFHENPSTPMLALGISESSLLNLTNQYARIASLGMKISPSFISSIYDGPRKIYQKKEAKGYFFRPSTSRILCEMLTLTFDTRFNHYEHVTGGSISPYLSHTYAGKSGLTNTDSYFIGFNPNITIGIWTGYDDNTLLESSIDLSWSKFMWMQLIEELNYDKSWYEKSMKGVISKNVSIHASIPAKASLLFYDSRQYYPEL